MRVTFLRSLQLRIAILAAGCFTVLFFCSPRIAHATLVVKNKYIEVDVNDATGQFRIWDVKKNSGLMYGDGHTSFITLRYRDGNSSSDIYLSNANDPIFAPCATHVGMDSVKKVGDTVTSYLTKYGILFRLRLYPFITPTGTTGQVMIEFLSEKVDPATSTTLTGILWQNDVAVNGDGAGGCNTSGDHPVVLTSSHYDARPNPSTAICWVGVQNSYNGGGIPELPDYYHVAQGFPNYTCSSCGFAYGKLRGAGLTPPDTFYVGDWGSTQPGFKSVCWDVNAPYFSSGAGYYDAAVIYKWIVHSNPSRIATVYGLDDTVNDLRICPGPLFKEVTYPLQIARDSATGTYNPSPATVKMYVINVNHNSYTASGVVPIMDISNTKHLIFAGKTRSTLQLAGTFQPGNANNIGASEGYYATWQLGVDTTTFNAKGIVDVEPINLKVNLNNSVQMGDDGSVCPINITVIGEGLPPRDTLAPIVQTTARTRYQTKWTAVDNRQHDKGIDSVIVTRNVGNNYLVTVAPSPFPQCDPLQQLTITAKVIDTSKITCVDIHVRDCAGNDTMISECFSPRIDSIPPQVNGVDSSGKFAGSPACNNRCRTFLAWDNRTTDYGLGTITTKSTTNFTPVVVNNGSPIKAHDTTATYKFCVIDSMRNAHADLEIRDFIGNLTKQSVDYCSLQDSTPPVIRVTRGAGKTVSVLVTELRAWDRGLSRVYLDPSSVNVKTIPATIVWTRDSAVFQIAAVDTLQPASFSVCANDSFFTANASDKALYYSSASTQHQQCIPGNFSGEDTLAPNVIITPITSTSARVEVNDIHIIGGVKYPLDLGLQSVVIDSHNVVIDSGSAAVSNCEPLIKFTFHVRDTLAFCDTTAYIHVSAIDCRFNASPISTWRMSIKPDNLPPIITSIINAQGKVQVTVTDNRAYDRGLGTVTLTNPVNVTPHTPAPNDGHATETFTIDIIDPNLDASATLTVTDRWGASCALPPVGIHTETIPFNYSGLSLALGSLTLLHENERGTIALTRVGSFTNKNVVQIDCDVKFDSSSLDFDATAQTGSPITTITRPSSGTLHVHMANATGITDAMPLPVLTFRGLFLKMDSSVVKFSVSNIVVNGGTATRVNSADGSSFLLIPPPRISISPGQIVVQKNCDRSGSAALFTVSQNFPNPFWDNAEVHYNIPGSGHVRMTIYDVFGKEVSAIVDADQSAGEHVVQLASAGLTPGTYFYKVRALCNTCVQEFVAVKRMVVAR